jgi:glutathione S-transferase
MTNTNHPLIRIHGAFPWDRGAKARWLLTEIGVGYEDRTLEEKDFTDPAFLKLNPMGRMPVMEFGDTPVFESSAICAYLADHYLDKGMAPALSSPARATYQQWMYFAVATLDSFQTRIMIIEDIPAGELRAEKEKPLLQEVEDALRTLDVTFAKNNYLVANKFSAADICTAYTLAWLPLWPEFSAIVDKFPRVKSYISRMKEMPSAVKAKVFTYEG